MADRLRRTLVAGNPVRFQITGLDQLEAKLQELPRKFARKAIREALRPAAEIIQREMEHLAHKATGWLAAHITLRVSTSGQDRGRATIGFSSEKKPRAKGRQTDARYEALYNEFGTRKMAARPFIRPAFDAKAESALDIIIRKLRENLEQEAQS